MPINVDDGIFAALREAGSSDSQIEDAKLVLGPLCQMQGHVCVLTATGVALESEKSIKWLQENKPHLLPRANQVRDAELAFTGVGNKTAAARLYLASDSAEHAHPHVGWNKPTHTVEVFLHETQATHDAIPLACGPSSGPKLLRGAAVPAYTLWSTQI